MTNEINIFYQTKEVKALAVEAGSTRELEGELPIGVPCGVASEVVPCLSSPSVILNEAKSFLLVYVLGASGEVLAALELGHGKLPRSSWETSTTRMRTIA